MSLRMLTSVVGRTASATSVVPRLTAPVPKIYKNAKTIPNQIVLVRHIQTSNARNSILSPPELGPSGFTMEGLKKHWSAIPMVVICVLVVVGVPIAGFYIAMTRPDLKFHKNWDTLAEKIDLDNAPYLKIVKSNDPSSNNLPEVAELYREMGVTTNRPK